MTNYGYVRTSIKSIDPENQLRSLRKYVPEDSNIFVEEAQTGNSDPLERKAFKELLKKVSLDQSKKDPKLKEQEQDILYIYEISRFGRNSMESVKVFIKIIEEYKLLINTLSPYEQAFNDAKDRSMQLLLFHIYSMAAEQERRNLSERTKEGLETARRNGQYIGRPIVFIDWDEAQRLHKEGKDWTQIAKHLGVKYVTLMAKKKTERPDLTERITTIVMKNEQKQ